MNFMDLNIISFNIRYCDDKNGNSIHERAPRLNKIISCYDADLIGFQEYVPQWEKYIKKYFAKPEIIMEEGDSIPLDALGDCDFCAGHSPKESAKSVLEILGKSDVTEICYDDVASSDKLFSSFVINGDGVLPADCINEDEIALVVKDIITCTGGADDICGVKGISRLEKEDFFAFAKSIREWRETAVNDEPKIFFLKDKTDVAAKAFTKVQSKINDYFLRCSLINYDEDVKNILKAQTDKMFVSENGSLFPKEKLAELPLAICAANKPLPLDSTINPAWQSEINDFNENVIKHFFDNKIDSLTEENWRKIEKAFEPYLAWYKAMPENPVSVLGLDRINEILNSNAEEIIDEYLSGLNNISVAPKVVFGNTKSVHFTPNEKPKTLSEAGEIFSKMLK